MKMRQVHHTAKALANEMRKALISKPLLILILPLTKGELEGVEFGRARLLLSTLYSLISTL
jgi:hypothetical protein